MRNGETAVFIDGPNVYATAKALGLEIDYKLLLEYYTANCDLIRAFYYTAVRERKPDERDSIRPLLDWLEYNGYTLVQKPTKEWADPMGGRPKIKGNMDIDIAVDALDLSQSIRNAIFFTGDGDFKPLILSMQRRGVRCTVVSSIQTQPPMCSDELRRTADMANLNQTRPEYGHKFWQIGWGSGKIVVVNYAMKTVTVSFYEKGHRVYTFDSLIGCYERSFGGTWMVHDADIGE